MVERTEVVTVRLEDGTSIKIAAASLGGEEDVLDLDEVVPFKQVTDSIEGIATAITSTLQKVEPNKTSVEFGVRVAIESGTLTALLVKGTGNANLKITLE